MHFSERQKHLPPNFMMENLFQDLYGVDVPAHWEAYSAPRSPINGLKGRGLRGRREWRGLWEKVAKEEGKGETEREWEGGGNGELE